MKLRPHYTYTVVHFFQYGYLLLIPLVQLLLPGAGQWNRTVLLQLMTACAMVLFFELRRRKTVFQLAGGILTLRRGILLRSQIRTDLRQTILHLKAGPLLRLLGGVKLIPEPDTKARKKPIFSFYMRLEDAQCLLDQLGFSPASLEPAARTGLRQAFTCAVFSSNSRVGFLALAPLFQAVGKLFEIDPAAPLLGAVSRLEQVLSGFIPPLFTGIAALLIAGYVLSILYLTERSCRFRLYSAPGRFAMAYGLLTRWTTLLPQRSVPAIATRSTTLMRACSLVQAIAITPNSARSGAQGLLLLPIANKRQAASLLFSPLSDPIRIPKSTVWRVYLPVLALAGAGCAVGFFGGELLPELRIPLAGITILLALAALAALIPCSVRERSACLSRSGPQAQNTRALSLYRTRLTQPPAALIVSQTPAQYREGICSAALRPHSGVPFQLSVPHLPLRTVQKNFPSSG